MADIYAALITHLSHLEQVGSVYRELPHNADLGTLPALDLQDPGPAGRKPAWQGLGWDAVDIDVDLYITRTMWLQGLADPLANTIRHHLYTFRAGQMRAVEVTRPTKRSDRNENIRRLGMTVTVLVPAFSQKGF